jgi:hypothetical protein
MEPPKMCSVRDGSHDDHAVIRPADCKFRSGERDGDGDHPV